MLGRQVSHFYVIRSLGSGGMGVVYEAQDTRLPRSVAIKFLKPDRARDRDSMLRFKREAHLTSSLNHQNICTVLEVDESSGQDFIAMELLQGMSLKARLAAGSLSLDEIIDIAIQMAAGLGAVHTCGIVHRDITPGNIFLCESGLVKLLDFGLAKQIPTEGSDGSDGLTADGRVAGTIHYMAPERLRGGKEVDYRCDLFSFGAVLYQMATGSRPFQAHSHDAVLSMILDDPHLPVRQLEPSRPVELERIVDRLLSKRASDRYQSVAALEDELRGLRRIAPGLARAESARVPTLSVAVLPFEAIGARREAVEALCHGLAEDIGLELSKLNQISLVPRTSIRACAGQTAAEIARRLRASLLIEGTVQQSGEDVRVIATLLDAAREAALAGPAVFDGPFPTTLSAQQAVAHDITTQLTQGLGSAQRRITDDEEALHAYKRGMHQFQEFRYVGGWRQAIEHFQHAISRDPRFVLAHVALARAYNFLGYFCLMRPNLAFSVAAEAAERALRVDERCVWACTALGSARFGRDWDWDQAETLYRRSLDLDPSDPMAHMDYSWLLTLVGRTDAGLAEARLGRSLAPSSSYVAACHAHTLYLARRFDEGLDICDGILREDPNQVFALHVRGLCCLCQDLGEEAISAFEAVASLTNRTPFYLGLLGLCYGRFGAEERGLRLLEELNAMSADTYVHPQCYTFVYSGLHRQEKIEFQERAYEHGASPFNYLTPFIRELYNLDLNRLTHKEQMRLIV